MQLRYLFFGLLLAAIFVAANWINGLPGIPPVRLDAASGKGSVTPGNRSTVKSKDTADSKLLDPDDAGQPAAAAVAENEAASDPLPTLNDSDEWVRGELADVALPWLAQTELVRTTATVLENASRGEISRKFLGFLAPEGRFEVRKMGSLIQVDPASYERYTPFVKALEQLSPERAAQLFEVAEPLLAEAVRELGERRVSPRELAFTALEVALDTPRVDASTALKQPKVFYTYADKELESLKPLQKQLLRMGPENLHTIRLWLEDFGLALSSASVRTDGPDDKMLATDVLRK